MFIFLFCAHEMITPDSYKVKFVFQRFSKFILEKYNHTICEDDKREFLNGWYILVIISDILAIVGSILKMEIQAKVLVDALFVCLYM